MTIDSPWRRRERGDAQVDGTADQFDLDAAILRLALLRDVHRRHDLQARKHRTLDVLGQRLRLEAEAVDAEPDAHAIRHGLDVDVGRAGLQRLLEHLVHEADDRRVIVLFLLDGEGRGRTAGGATFSPTP